MRPASCLAVKCTSAFSVLAVVVAFSSLTFAQSAPLSKRKLSQRVSGPRPPAVMAARPAEGASPLATTTNTWTGGGGSSNTNWSDAANWNNGAITSGENIVINLTTANTVDDQSYTIGTLTLSNAGDSVTLNNNVDTTVTGNISNNGTITFAANGNVTGLYLNNSLTLSGSGTIDLSTSGTNYTAYLYGAAGSVLTTSSNIVGAGTVGNGQLNFANSGTMNANISGQTLLLNPDTCTGCTNTNTGTLEATNGGTLVMDNGAWTQTGAGNITAANNSAVYLQNNVSITGGTLTTSGSGVIYGQDGYDVFLTNVTNNGNYVIQNYNTTEVSGTITNNGTITIDANGNATGLYLTGNTTLAGTGTINLTSPGANYTGLLWGATGAVLTNQTTIEGWGTIGNGNLQIANASNGIINSNQSGGNIVLNPDTSVTNTNAGLMEATNGGTLTMDSGTWTNTGTIEAQAGSAVNLYNNVSITGGTLESVGTGSVNNLSGYNVFLSGLTLAGTYNIQNYAATEITGTITNNGTINILGNGNTTELYVNTGSATLTGSGSVVMGSAGSNYTDYLDGAGGTSLIIDQPVSGAGNIGNGNLTLTNNSTIDANLSPTVTGTALTIQPSSGGMTNTATLEATNGGTLAFDGGNITNTGGTIEALGADSDGNGSNVELYNGVSITGGTLTTTGTGQFYVPAGYQANLTTLTLSTGSVLNVQNNGELNVNGTITNNGTISLQANGNYTYLYAPTNTTLTGTGSVVLTSSGSNYTGVIETASGVTLTNDETISGWGTIENGTLVNNGTINANQSGGVIVLQSLTGTNTKTMEATNGGTLVFNGTTWTQTGVGTITAQNNSAVELYNNANITGGTLTTAGNGQFYVPASYVAYLSTLTNSGTVNINNYGELELTGTITNNGSFNVQGNGNNTYLLINGAVTLNGTGTIDLSSTNGSYTNFIYGEGTTPTLTSHNTIEGSGNLGSSNMGFTNDGTVLSNVSGGNIGINVDSSGFTNYNATTTTLTGGTYIANPGNITYDFGNATGITTLAASVTEENGGQFINSENSTNALANLTSITSAGALTTDVNFTDPGAFSNAGSLTILGGTTFEVASLTQSSGGSLTAGTYVLDANLDITGTAQTITTNAASLTLAGGTIENTSNSTNALAGLATNSGKLTIGGTSNNVSTTASSFSNTGTLTIDSGDSFTAAKLTQVSGTTLSGGTYVLAGNLDLTTTGISITTNSATLTLEGGTINSGSSNALAGLASNTKSLTIAGTGVNVSTSASSFSNTGKLTIDSGDSFTAGNLTQISGGTLTGGTYVVAGNLDLTTTGISITTNSAALTLEGGTIMSGSSNALAALANNTSNLTLADQANFTTAGNFSNAGTLTVNSGSTFSVTGTLSNLSSGTLSGGTFVVGGTLQLASANGGITTNGANLTLTGTSAKVLDGTSNALSSLSSNNGGLTLTGNATLTTSSSLTNTGSVDVAKGSTLTVSGTGGAYTQAVSGGTIVTTIDGTLAGISGGAIIQDGTLQGAGTIKGNLTAGNSSGSAVTINAGDAGKAGLLSITGTYTQLSTGTLNVSVGGATVGTQYSQLKISGAASLGGTLTASLINAFTPTVGQSFTILTASSISGTFSNSTIAIDSSEHFVISYTATGVVLTVAAGAAPTPANHLQPVAPLSPWLEQTTQRMPTNTLKQRVELGIPRSFPHLTTDAGPFGGLRKGILSGAGIQYSARTWEPMPILPSVDHVGRIAGTHPGQVLQLAGRIARSDLGHRIDERAGQIRAAVIFVPPIHTAPVRAPLVQVPETSLGMSIHYGDRAPVGIVVPSPPKMR